MSKKAGWNIPGDWDGEAWRCVTIQWPDSVEYSRLLVGLLYTLTRGREYDESTGTVKDAQSVGWEIFDKNFPFLECAQADENGNGISDDAPCGGGIVILGGDDVGQVVTDVWVDVATNQLVVEYGPCCIKRYYLPDVVGGETFGGADDELPDEPDYPPLTADYTRCAKASAIWGVWVEAVDIILDQAAGLQAPWAVEGILQAAFPSINFGSVSVLHAYTAAISVETQGYASETETEAWMKEVKCAWALIGEDDGAGWSSDQWDTALSFCSSIAAKHFTPVGFPTGFGDMQAVWFYTAQAIGKSDAKDITTRVVPTGAEDCDCGDGGIPSGMDWVQVFDFTENQHGWSIVEEDYLAGTGFRGTDNWGNGSRLNDARSPYNAAEVTGIVRYARVEWTRYDLSVAAATQNAGLFLDMATDVNIANLATIIALNSDDMEFVGAWPYTAVAIGGVRLTYGFSFDETGNQRFILKKITMAGTGDKPIPDPV